MSQLNVWEQYFYDKHMRAYRVEWTVVSHKEQYARAMYPAPIWITNIEYPTWGTILEGSGYADLMTAGLMLDGDYLTIHVTDDRNTIEKWLEENLKYGGEIRDTRTERSPNVNVL